VFFFLQGYYIVMQIIRLQIIFLGFDFLYVDFFEY